MKVRNNVVLPFLMTERLILLLCLGSSDGDKDNQDVQGKHNDQIEMAAVVNMSLQQREERALDEEKRKLNQQHQRERQDRVEKGAEVETEVDPGQYGVNETDIDTKELKKQCRVRFRDDCVIGKALFDEAISPKSDLWKQLKLKSSTCMAPCTHTPSI